MGRDLEPVFPEWRRGEHPRLKLGRPPHLLGAFGEQCLESAEAGPVLDLKAAAPQVVDDEQI